MTKFYKGPRNYADFRQKLWKMDRKSGTWDVWIYNIEVRRSDYIKMDLNKIGWVCVFWIRLAYGKNRCLTQSMKKNPTRCNNVSKLYYSLFIWSSTCFGRHTAHHQEPKTALAASGFSYVEGCWTCSWWTLSDTYCAWQRSPTTSPATSHVWKTQF